MSTKRHAGTGVWLRRAHLLIAAVWALSVIPTLVWWSDSVLWVALLSVWANVAAHLGAYQGSRAETADCASCQARERGECPT